MEHFEPKDVGLCRLAQKMVDRVSAEQTRIEYNHVPGADGRKTSANPSKISLLHYLIGDKNYLLITTVCSVSKVL